MSALVFINSTEVEFKRRDENIFINSIDLGKVFKKEHKNILQLIENLPNDEFRALNFNKSDYLDSRGRLQPCYNLTKDGFCLLVMGFTGEKAYKFKVEFIKAFNRLLDENKALKYAYYVDKIASLEAVALSKSKYHNDQINGYKGVIVKRNNVVKALKDEIKNKDSVYSLLENAVIQADKEIKRLELKNKEILQSIKGKDTGIYDKHYEYLEKENKELRKLVRKDGRVDADVYLGLKSEVEKRINNTCYLIEDIKEKLNFDLEDLQRYVFYGKCKNDPKQAEIKLKSKIQRMNNGN